MCGVLRVIFVIFLVNVFSIGCIIGEWKVWDIVNSFVFIFLFVSNVMVCFIVGFLLEII